MKACFIKRMAAFCLVTALIVGSLSACKAEESDHLAYQEYPIRAECVFSVGGGDYPLILDVTSPGVARVTFVGSRLEGGVVEISGSGAYFINAGYRVPLTLTDDSALFTLVCAFGLSSSDMIGVTEEGGGLLVGYDCGSFGATVTLLDNIPSAIEIVCRGEVYTLIVNKFTSGA